MHAESRVFIMVVGKDAYVIILGTRFWCQYVVVSESPATRVTLLNAVIGTYVIPK
jgi:hypothetical protein